MDSLRLALLVMGAIVVGAVYLTTRKRESAQLRHSKPGARIEPRFDASDEEHASPDLGPLDDTGVMQAPITAREPDPDGNGAFAAAEDEGVSEREPESTARVPEKVISLRIVAKNGGNFPAEKIILALRDSGLVHGRFGIFHKLYEDQPDGETVFAAANLVEPGSFDLKNVRDKTLPGLSFFLVRPGPGRGVEGYDKMVETARSIAITLGGDLVDGDGSTFSIQRERFLREELIQYELDNLNLS